jgi:hypothetical protein
MNHHHRLHQLHNNEHRHSVTTFLRFGILCTTNQPTFSYKLLSFYYMNDQQHGPAHYFWGSASSDIGRLFGVVFIYKGYRERIRAFSSRGDFALDGRSGYER